MKAHVIHMTDGSMTVEYPFNMAVAVTTKVQTLSNTADHQMQISRRILLPDGLTYRVDWKYFQRRSGEASRSRKTKAMERAGRKLRVGSYSDVRPHPHRHDHFAPVLVHGVTSTLDGKRLLVVACSTNVMSSILLSF